MLVSSIMVQRSYAQQSTATPATSPSSAKGTVLAGQERLKVLGYDPGPADGVMGSRTIAALKKFEADHGLAVTETLDEKTLQVLQSTKATTTTNPTTKESVQEAQQRLKTLGYEPGPADGVMGSRTTAALKKFQTDRVLPVTAKLDKKTLDALGVKGVSESSSASALVRQGQQRLQVLGYEPGPPSGEMDGKTIEALKKFQADHGLVPFADKIDQKLLDALNVTDPLTSAVKRGDLGGIRALLASGASPNASGDPHIKGWTPLMQAAFSGNVDAARLLLDSGATVDATNEFGKTALYVALRAGCSTCSTLTGNLQVAELLRGRGAKAVDSEPKN
jgi:peptidoglycan hydrolase-like protein with peptidoglycan-binding domain